MGSLWGLMLHAYRLAENHHLVFFTIDLTSKT